MVAKPMRDAIANTTRPANDQDFLPAKSVPTFKIRSMIE
jgi:hypothetical protein